MKAELPGALDDHGHPPQLRLGELILRDGLLEHHPRLGVGPGLLVGSLHDPHGAGSGLESAVLEALHLVVEAPAPTGLLADEVLRGDEPVFEGDLVAVHAAVAERVDRPPGHLAAAILDMLEAMAIAPRLLDDEDRQALVVGGARLGAGEYHQHVGPAGEGAPCLYAVDDPTAIGRGGAHPNASDVGSVVRLGDRDGGHDLARGKPRQPVQLLLLGAACDQGTSEDLGPCDQRTADAERAAGEFLGGNDHAEVVVDATLGEAAVLDRRGETEDSELRESLDELLGHVGVGAVHVLGPRGDLLVGEPTEGVGGELHVLVKV